MDEEVTVDEIKAALRKGAPSPARFILSSSVLPTRTKGVQELPRRCRRLHAAPTDVAAIKGINPSTNEEGSVRATPQGSVCRSRLQDHDRPVRRQADLPACVLWHLGSGSYVSNACKDKKERIGRLLQMHSNNRIDIDVCSAGDIVAVVGLKDTSTGDTLCDERHRLSSSPWNSPIRLSTSPSSPRPRLSRTR